MIGKIFLKFFSLIIGLVDLKNKLEVINFFKKKFNKHKINVVDIGSHKGETIDLFVKNFNINKIYSFEPNLNLYNQLVKKEKYKIDKIKLFNLGIGNISEKKELNVFQDTSSSTLNSIDEDSQYFKRKKRFMSLFNLLNNFDYYKQTVNISNFSEIINKEKIELIDILKIDTEGYEYNILKGISELDFKKIKFIYFEHHFDLMINKGYKFNDINRLLTSNNFQRKYKIRMKFRKSFEYIYENSKK